MRWEYNDDFRDQFSKGPHRNILIVPHATNVIPNPGGPPTITNKRPVFDWDDNAKKYYPRKVNNEFVLDEVDWVITNDDITKEKFRYSYSLNSEQNLTFSSCNSAMVQFTIRNKKEYVEELDDEGNPTGNWYWEQEIPNLHKQEFTVKDPDGNSRLITGEVLSHAIIKVYTYINGNSASLLYLGMFCVEEDKLVDNGYNRQITAYDFMATFRDMDIFNWYKHLFTGINKNETDLEDATNKTGEEDIDSSDYDAEKNWIRKKQDKWKIKDALTDLINNLCAYDNVVYEDGEATMGNTVSNPNDYGRDGYPEGNGYSGFAMPVKLDPDILDTTKTRSIPTSSGPDQHECYGYMDIMELEFYQNPSIIKQESLSMGKFLEDIGMLAGRYPFIRTDYLEDNDYVDPNEITPTPENPYPSKYNNYERCVLSFKPLPSSKDDTNMRNTPEMIFSNHEIAKGFQHEYQSVEDIMIFKIPLDDNTEIEYKRLSKDQRVAASKSLLQTFNMPNNMFASYLVTKSDDKSIKKMLEKYKVIREDLFGKETKNGNMSSGAKFQQGYLDMKYRTYVPFKLTTFADPCRECGDRILINFQDKITGEITSFYSYILEREIEGVQKMMDTYTSNGNVKNPVITNYQAIGNKNKLNQNEYEDGIMSPSDLIEYMRNCGYRMLDEPSNCEANYVKSSMYSAWYVHAEDHNGSWDGNIPSEGDTSPHGLMYYDDEAEEWKNVEAEQPYDVFYEDDFDTTYYVYSTNGDWVEHNGNKIFTTSGYTGDIYNTGPDITFSDPNLQPGDTTNQLTINGREVNVQIGDCILLYNKSSNYGGESYWYPYEGNILHNFVVHKEDLGDEWEYWTTAWYVSPGVWSDSSAADDPQHRVLFGNSYGDEYGDHGLVDTYTHADKVVHWYEFDPVIQPGDSIDIISVNGVVMPIPSYGNYYDIYPYDPYYGDATGGDTNIDTTEAFTNGNNMTYVYPGIWIDAYHDPGNIPGYKIPMETKRYIALKWTDPDDIDDWKPYPCSWEGTIIIRKENSPPLHRWDGTVIVNCKTRDKYKTKPYKDENIQIGKTYYYGFFPYYTRDDSDPDHPIRYFTFTKVIEVSTSTSKSFPAKIESITVSARINIRIKYIVYSPDVGYITSVMLYGKIGTAPNCDDTDDYRIALDAYPHNVPYIKSWIDLENLTPNKTYYFCIVTNNTNDEQLTSNVESCVTGI